MHQNLFQDPEKNINLIFKVICLTYPPHLHNNQNHTTQVDGGFQRGNCLRMSQPIQTAIIDLQKQVSFLEDYYVMRVSQNMI